MTYTAVRHQGAIETSGLHFLGAIRSSMFSTVTGQTCGEKRTWVLLNLKKRIEITGKTSERADADVTVGFVLRSTHEGNK